MADKTCSIEGCRKPMQARSYCHAHYKRWNKHGDPLINKTPNRGKPKLWIETSLSGEFAECVIWPFCRNDSGRAIIRISGKSVYVARMICEQVYSLPPSDRHEAAHSCGNGHLGCVNHLHLRWDTPEGNQSDRVLHGTSNRGDRNGRAKLSERDVRLILPRIDKGELLQPIADDFGVSFDTISAIKCGRTWGWLTGRSRADA